MCLDFLKDRDVVDLKNKTFDVHVETPAGQYISVPVVSSDTIETVKTRIQEASAMQTSSFDLCRHVLRNRDASLSEVVQRNSNLHMALNLASGREAQIFVRLLTGLTRTFPVRLDDSVGHLKLMILQDRSMSLDGVRLVLGGKNLSEDDRPLSDYRVRDHSTLDLWVSLSGD